jgi:hypothetical protein
MPPFTRLIRFESASGGQIYFADLGADVVEPPSEGTHVRAYASLDDLLAGKAEKIVRLGKVMTSPIHIISHRSFQLMKIKSPASGTTSS